MEIEEDKQRRGREKNDSKNKYCEENRNKRKADYGSGDQILLQCQREINFYKNKS